MVPMRTVSACAWAKRQSRLRAAAAAAEFFRSVRREVFIAFPPRNRRQRRPLRPVLRAVVWLSIWRTECNVNAAGCGHSAVISGREQSLVIPGPLADAHVPE